MLLLRYLELQHLQTNTYHRTVDYFLTRQISKISQILCQKSQNSRKIIINKNVKYEKIANMKNRYLKKR